MTASAMSGSLARFGCNSQILPPEGPCTYSFNLNFETETAREMDFTTQIQNGTITFVQSVYIDNSGNADPITVTAEGTNQSVTIPGGYQAWQPMLLTDDAKLTVSTTALAGKYIPFQVVNFPVHPDVWRSTATSAAPTSFITSQLPATLGPKAGAASLSVVPNNDTPFPIVGNVADGAANTGNPVSTGGVAMSILPTYTAGNRATATYTLRGGQYVTLVSAAGVSPGTLVASADAISAGTSVMAVGSFGLIFNGTAWDRQRGDVNGTVDQPFAMSASRFIFAGPAAGVNVTAAQTIIAASAGLKNYLTSIDISSSVATTTVAELTIMNGATVLWRRALPVGIQNFSKTFDVPLPTGVNVALTYVLSAIPGAGIYVNAQGFQSAV